MGFHVFDLHFAAQGYHVFGNVRILDDLGVPNHVFQGQDPTFYKGLFVFGIVIFGVFADVPVGNGDFQPFGNLLPFLGPEVIQFVF